MPPKEKLTSLEKQMSKKPLLEDIEVPLSETEVIKDKLEVDWKVIDTATNNYAKMLQEYDIAEIVKSLYQRYGKSKVFYALPKPGNIDLGDKELGFENFLQVLDEVKEKSPKKLTDADITTLREHSKAIVDYIISGKHTKADKKFSGWKTAFAAAKRARKEVVLGILSVDLPMIVQTRAGNLQYKASGTQHYVAFAYDTRSSKLYIFDSAAKNPINDKTEAYYIIKFVMDEIMGAAAASSSSIDLIGLSYRNILQPGAGDKKEEDERSYNNQNVFCHTWSLWFCLVFIVFYKTDKIDTVLKFIQSLSHRNQALNLAMIKRFAGWMTTFLADDEDSADAMKQRHRFPVRIYEREKALGTAAAAAKVQGLLSDYAIRKNPYMGLNYIWNYKTGAVMKVERLCLRRKVKLDVDLLDELNRIDINKYIEKSKEIRCPIGYFVNKDTKRCRMLTKSKS